MTDKVTTHGQPFTVIAPNIQGSTDPARDPIGSGNADVIRQAFTCQIVQPGPDNRLALIGETPFTEASGDIELVGGTFPSGDVIIVGEHQIIEGVHFDGTGGAAALATAIDSLSDLTATVAGAVVTVATVAYGATLPTFRVINKTNPANWEITTGDGTLIDAIPLIIAPVVTS